MTLTTISREHQPRRTCVRRSPRLYLAAPRPQLARRGPAAPTEHGAGPCTALRAPPARSHRPSRPGPAPFHRGPAGSRGSAPPPQSVGAGLGGRLRCRRRGLGGGAVSQRPSPFRAGRPRSCGRVVAVRRGLSAPRSGDGAAGVRWVRGAGGAGRAAGWQLGGEVCS